MTFCPQVTDVDGWVTERPADEDEVAEWKEEEDNCPVGVEVSTGNWERLSTKIPEFRF